MGVNLDRINGKNKAQELLDLLDLQELKNKEFVAGLLAQITEELAPPKPRETAEPPKDHKGRPVPVARLGREAPEFGKYRGIAYDDIPMAYLDWLCEHQEDSLKKLHGYLKHPGLEKHRREIGAT